MFISEKLALSNGRPTGFDYMRIILAFLVIWMHTVRVCYGNDSFIWETPLRPFLKMILPMFFCLSGFLVAGSVERSNTLITFVGNRLIRIYPALTVEVLLSALILGTFFTTYSLYDYVTDPLFFHYLINVTGHISFQLPGVFEQNPDAGIVNVQLWTVPFELRCYVVISLVIALGIYRRRILLPAVTVLALLLACLRQYWRSGGDDLEVVATNMPGNFLVVSFLLGVTLYAYRNRVVWDARLFLACCLLIAGAFYIDRFADIVSLPAIAYITIYLGLFSPRKIAVLRGADYSYGVFLYGFPIQQAFAAISPIGQVWFVNGLVTSVLATSFAALSWHYVEKPALGLKLFATRLEQYYLDVRKRAIDV